MITEIVRCNLDGRTMYGLTVNDKFCGFFETVQDAILWAPTYASLYQPFLSRSQGPELSLREQGEE